MFYYPVPDGCIDLGCFTYCNGTGYFPPVPEPSIIIPLLLLIFWCFICLVLVLEGIAISIGFVLYLLNCPTGKLNNGDIIIVVIEMSIAEKRMFANNI